jgi:hypothetical protein
MNCWSQRSPVIRIGISPEDHVRAVDQAFVRGAVGMAQLQVERERQAKIRARVARRAMLARTKWFGAGALVAFVLTLIIVGGAP